MDIALDTISETSSEGGTQGVYRHVSATTGTGMTFALYMPPGAEGQRFPVLWYLSGLTCTHANVMEKGKYQAACAEHGVILIAPDTSPRGADVPDDDAYDLGQGAGFYVDATEEPWTRNFRMKAYVEEELPGIVAGAFACADMQRQAIMGHSMGGHGALTIALRNPDRFRSVSAIAPIVSPTRVPWGEKALTAYLGAEREAWHSYDATLLIREGAKLDELLVDQGEADEYLAEQLRPELLEDVVRECAEGMRLTLNRHPGEGHGYDFVSKVLPEHVAWHAARLKH